MAVVRAVVVAVVVVVGRNGTVNSGRCCHRAGAGAGAGAGLRVVVVLVVVVVRAGSLGRWERGCGW